MLPLLGQFGDGIDRSTGQAVEINGMEVPSVGGAVQVRNRQNIIEELCQTHGIRFQFVQMFLLAHGIICFLQQIKTGVDHGQRCFEIMRYMLNKLLQQGCALPFRIQVARLLFQQLAMYRLRCSRR